MAQTINNTTAAEAQTINAAEHDLTLAEALAAFQAELDAEVAADANSVETFDAQLVGLSAIVKNTDTYDAATGEIVPGNPIVDILRVVTRKSDGTLYSFPMRPQIAQNSPLPFAASLLDANEPKHVQLMAAALSGAAITLTRRHHVAGSLYAKWTKAADGTRRRVATESASAGDIVDVIAVTPTAAGAALLKRIAESRLASMLA